jgi:hypothetical protein
VVNTAALFAWSVPTIAAEGLRVLLITDDYECPAGQRLENDADRMHPCVS